MQRKEKNEEDFLAVFLNLETELQKNKIAIVNPDYVWALARIKVKLKNFPINKLNYAEREFVISILDFFSLSNIQKQKSLDKVLCSAIQKIEEQIKLSSSKNSHLLNILKEIMIDIVYARKETLLNLANVSNYYTYLSTKSEKVENAHFASNASLLAAPRLPPVSPSYFREELKPEKKPLANNNISHQILQKEEVKVEKRISAEKVDHSKLAEAASAKPQVPLVQFNLTESLPQKINAEKKPELVTKLNYLSPASVKTFNTSDSYYLVHNKHGDLIYCPEDMPESLCDTSESYTASSQAASFAENEKDFNGKTIESSSGILEEKEDKKIVGNLASLSLYTEKITLKQESKSSLGENHHGVAPVLKQPAGQWQQPVQYALEAKKKRFSVQFFSNEKNTHTKIGLHSENNGNLNILPQYNHEKYESDRQQMLTYATKMYMDVLLMDKIFFSLQLLFMQEKSSSLHRSKEDEIINNLQKILPPIVQFNRDQWQMVRVMMKSMHSGLSFSEHLNKDQDLKLNATNQKLKASEADKRRPPLSF